MKDIVEYKIIVILASPFEIIGLLCLRQLEIFGIGLRHLGLLDYYAFGNWEFLEYGFAAWDYWIIMPSATGNF